MIYISRLLCFSVRPTEEDFASLPMYANADGTYYTIDQWMDKFDRERVPGETGKWADRTMYKTDAVVISAEDRKDWFYLDYRVSYKLDKHGNTVLNQYKRPVLRYEWEYRSFQSPCISLGCPPLLVKKEPDYFKREIGFRGDHVLSDPINRPDIKQPKQFMPLTIVGLGTGYETPPEPLIETELPSPPYSPFGYTFHRPCVDLQWSVSDSDATSTDSMSISSNTDEENAILPSGTLSCLQD